MQLTSEIVVEEVGSRDLRELHNPLCRLELVSRTAFRKSNHIAVVSCKSGRGCSTRFQCAGGEKTLGFFAAGEEVEDDIARLAGVGGTVIEVERGRERRVGVGSLAERVMAKLRRFENSGGNDSAY